ncbi:DUF302 domain-containing protein [Desulfopila sp. IMCC35006]|uniref:DUF302 domain-containing protein n=1 Tax=Desulfopila sp. IMCC35006 TaxID=2569542 RepID=UPI0010AD2B47|nr:DUF302 domain-containing protein [Desulfopila sp. IMCC35006]TKB28438.1 DUF302 domain-containing protein [Desulfopila sp. IMCC35006]
MHDLHKTMTHIGVEVVRRCLVLEVGQSQEEKVFEQNPRIFSVFSCRISMYEEGNRTVLAILKPSMAYPLEILCNFP